MSQRAKFYLFLATAALIVSGCAALVFMGAQAVLRAVLGGA